MRRAAALDADDEEEDESEGKEVIERARSVTFLPERRGLDDSEPVEASIGAPRYTDAAPL